MFKVEFPLRDGLGSNDVTGKVLLNSFCSAQFQVIGMQLEKEIAMVGLVKLICIYTIGRLRSERKKGREIKKNTYSFDSRGAHITHCEIWRESSHAEDKCSQLSSWAESASENKKEVKLRVRGGDRHDPFCFF